MVETYDRQEEAANIAQDMRSAVGLMLGAGGVAALGILITATVAASFVDITGITAALVSGAVGLFVICPTASVAPNRSFASAPSSFATS